MASISKVNFLATLKEKFGVAKKLPNSQSLYELGDGSARIYIRYSKLHQNRKQAFYGLRKDDLKILEGFNSFVCFLFDDQSEPIFLPYCEFEEIFSILTPSSDGQIKASIFFNDERIELYISNSGRFNLEGYIGWNFFAERIDKDKLDTVPEFSHSQIQSILGSIGVLKGFDIWVPSNDRNKLDWNIVDKFDCINEIPRRYDKIGDIIREIDIMWIKRGSSQVSALFEVEHSTPVYSGLLRFNDVHITVPDLKATYGIVSNYLRRSLFLRQINRPTFKESGLIEYCNFLDYKDVFFWHNRLKEK
jgi:hypothetical protein